MRKTILKIFRKYQGEIIISAIYIFFSLINWGKTYDIALWDFGREVYIPQYMHKGYLLYKDIFNIFGPLSYQINFYITSVFGNNLNVFFSIGLLAGIVCSIFVYKIIRQFMEYKAALITANCVILFYFVAFNKFNIPYSYAAVFAQMGSLISINYFLKFINKQNDKGLYISFIFLGFSLANKYEYVVYGLASVVYIFLRFPNKLVKTLLATFFIPTISILELFIRGVKPNDLYRNSLLVIKYAESPSLKNMYSISASFIPNLGKEIEAFILFICTFTIIYSFGVIIKKLKSDRDPNFIGILKNIAYVILLIASTAICLAASNHNYAYLPLLILGYLINTVISKNFNKDLILSWLLIAGITTSTKGFFVTTHYYAPFLILIAMIVFLILIYKEALKYKLSSSQATLIIAYLIIPVFLYYQYSFYTTTKEPLKTKKGVIYLRTDEFNQYTNLQNQISFIDKPNDLLIIPDGLFFSYILDLNTNINLEFMFMPPYMDAVGQYEVIKMLKTSNIKTIVIINRHPDMYFKPIFLRIQNLAQDTDKWYLGI